MPADFCSPQKICMWFWTLWNTIIKVLSTHGANLGQVDQQGDSALYWAARQGHHPVVK